MKLNLRKLPILTLEEVEKETGWDLKEEVIQSGTWRLMAGSRGYFEESERIGDLDCASVTVPSRKECWDILGVNEQDDPKNRHSIRQGVTEFYGAINVGSSVQFGYTDEEQDCYYKIEV